MDDIKPNRNIDGVVGSDKNQPPAQEPVQNTDGFNNAPGSVNYDVNRTASSHSKSSTSTTHDVNVKMPKQQAVVGNGAPKNRGLKLLLTLFIILFLAAAGAAAYFYMENNKQTSGTDSAELQKLKQENAALVYDNKTLVVFKTQNSELQSKIKNLTTTAKQLKDECGSSCRAIIIPQ